MGIEIAPDGILFVSVLQGTSDVTIFRSEDAGSTWKAVQKLSGGVMVSQFAFAGKGIVYAGLISFGD